MLVNLNFRSERYYAGIKDDPRLHVKLTGGWETLVGNQDKFGEYLIARFKGGSSNLL